MISSSGTALAKSRLGHPGHEPGELEDLLRALGWGELEVVAAQSRSLGFAVRGPVSGSFRGIHVHHGTAPTEIRPDNCRKSKLAA